MKKIKWENIIALVFITLYVKHSIGLHYTDLGMTVAQFAVIGLATIMLYIMIKAVRKENILKNIKDLFKD